MTRARNLANLGNKNAITADIGLFNIGIGSTQPHDYKLEVVGGDAYIGGGVTITGNLSVGGTVTYEDVTNVDAVGIITANKGVNIVGGGLTVTGVSTFFGAIDANGALDVDGHTELDDVNVSGVSTFTQGYFSDHIYLADKIVHTGDTNTAIRFPTNDTISAETGGSERFRITSDGKLLIGSTSNNNIWGVNAALQVEGTSGDTSAINVIRNTNDGGGALLTFGKSRATSDGGSTVVQSGDVVGAITWAAADGTDLNSSSAQMSVEVDGTPGSNDTPGRIIFKTTADGASGVTERLRIDSNGKIINTAATDTVATLDLYGGNSSVSAVDEINAQIRFRSKDASVNSTDQVGGTIKSITEFSNGAWTGLSFETFRQDRTPGLRETLRLDYNGNVKVPYGEILAGTSTSRTINSHVPKLQVTGYDYGDSTVSIINNENNANGSYLFFGKQRSGGPGGSTVVAANDIIGELRFNAADGSDLDNLAARIVVEVDGTPGNNDTPGRMGFYTAPDGSATATERMRLDQGGNLILGGTSAQASDAVTLRQDGEVTAAGFYFSNNIGSPMNSDGIRRATTGTMAFDTGSAERMRLDSSGRLLIGISAARTYEQPMPYGGNDTVPALQLEGAGASGGTHRVFGHTYNNNDVYAPTYIFAKTRGGATGAVTVVNSGDSLGQISFQGADGTDLEEAASIRAEVDGAPGDNDMPGRLIFSTTANGEHAVTDRMRIQQDGQIYVANSIGTSAIFGACVNDDTVLSNSGGLYNSSATNFIEVGNTGDGITGKEAGIIFRTRTSGAGAFAMYAARTSTYLSDMVWRTRSTSSGNTERMRLGNDGKLLINGSFQVNNFQIVDGGWASSWDTGISVNQSNAGACLIIMNCSNWDANDSTAAGVYIVRLGYSGNQDPQVWHISGNNSWTITKSGSNTVLISNASGNQRTAILWTT